MNNDVTKLSGEELAEILASQFQQLMMAQQNIQAIQSELQRRKSMQPPVESPQKEAKPAEVKKG